MNIDINLIALAITSFTSIVLLAILIRTKLRLNKSIEMSTQLWVDRTALQEELDKLAFINSNSTDIENGFIKFLSESRDQAFAYIEGVQAAIQDLENAMQTGEEPKIAIAYINLINFLPSDTQDVVN